MEAGGGALAMKGRPGVDVMIALASVLAVTLAPAAGPAAQSPQARLKTASAPGRSPATRRALAKKAVA